MTHESSTAHSRMNPNLAACAGVLTSSPEPITDPATTSPGPTEANARIRELGFDPPIHVPTGGLPLTTEQMKKRATHRHA